MLFEGTMPTSVSDLPVLSLGVLGAPELLRLFRGLVTPRWGLKVNLMECGGGCESGGSRWTLIRVSPSSRGGLIFIEDAVSSGAQWWWGLLDSCITMHYRNVNGFANYRFRK
ncbi:hypothetical protein FNV43_RR13452 [Rhamnella rubrinervis]|uniref:Uncharacterized protein n=1 Tax=Rhamnella rubrinervis TaxID=2594499 RepID=A0A8K0H128_9ROSA|nr:hypothetical protein FNV43_RR13452 [Rhamnella rubrinervis]